MVQDVAAGAAELRRDSGAEQADPARLHPEFPVDVPLLGPLGHLRRGLALEELPRHVTQVLQFVGHPLRDVVSRHTVASAPFPFPTPGFMLTTAVVTILSLTTDRKRRIVMAADGVLGGIKVVDLSEQVPGPYATRLLAGLGADVIKVERPDAGDRLRQRPVMFAAENRGKRDLSVALKSADGGGALLPVLAAGHEKLACPARFAGRRLDVAMSDCTLAMMEPRIAEALSEPTSADALVRPGYGVYLTADERYVTIGALEDHFWERLVPALGPDELAGAEFPRYQQRRRHIGQIERSLRERVAQLGQAALIELLIRHDVPV